MRKANRMLAVLLAGTMVMGTGLTAFAADDTGSTTGKGEFEGHVDKSVLLVQLPTVSAEAGAVNPFTYTMDPEGLIAATEGAKNKDATFESGANVYFLSAPNTYTKDSAKLKVVNKGTVDADVTVKAETAANTNVKMVTGTDGFTAAPTDDDNGAELYLGLLVDKKAAAAVQETGGSGTEASVTVGLKGNDKNYEVKYDEASKAYSYAAKADIPETAWNSFEFGLTGACNPKGDYSAANLAAADVTVTWSYVERADDSTAEILAENATEDAAPSITVKEYDYDRTTTFEIVANLGAGNQAATKIQSVKIGADGKTFGTDLTSACTIQDNKITFPSGKLMTAAVGDKKYVQVTFDKGEAVVLTLTIAK